MDFLLQNASQFLGQFREFVRILFLLNQVVQFADTSIVGKIFDGTTPLAWISPERSLEWAEVALRGALKPISMFFHQLQYTQCVLQCIRFL